MMVRNRKRNGDLAIVLLAELTARLPRYSNGVLAFFGKPVSSTIQASTGPCFSRTGSVRSRTLLKTAASDQGALPTKCKATDAAPPPVTAP